MKAQPAEIQIEGANQETQVLVTMETRCHKSPEQLREDCRKAHAYIVELELAFMDTQQSLLCVADELHDVKQELLRVKAELAAAEELKANALNDLNKLRSGMEAELNRKEHQLQSEREKIRDLTREIEVIKDEKGTSEDEPSMNTDKELELQVKISALKTELKRGMCRIAAAEAARIRAMASESSMYIAVQRLMVEAVAAKMESPKLKLEGKKVEDEEDTDSVTISTENDSSQKSVILYAPSKNESKIAEDSPKETSESKFAAVARRVMIQQRAREGIEEQLRKWRLKQQKSRKKSGRENCEIKHLTYQGHQRSKSFQPLVCTPMYYEKKSNHKALAKFLSMKM